MTTARDTWTLDRTFAGSAGTVRWAALGPADAPPVVLVHGTPFSSYVWRGVARALAGEHRVHVWDLAGYGSSEMRDGQDVSLAAQGRIFAELLGHWGLDRPAVVAHDFGGCVALRAHLLHGARYERLALVDPVALAPWGTATYRLLGANAGVFAQLPPALHEALVRTYVGSASHRGLHPAVLDRLVEPWCTEEGRPAFYRQIEQNDQRFTDEIQGRYGELRLPVLICWGAQDTWIPAAKGEELARLVPGAELRLIEGAGHLVQEDAPAELTGELLGFLRESRSR
ncbi:alpha/beta hydrolase [Streptomyces alfalfae]|uniref:Alpha/beta fold hydrolase n=1 Tax=Streptomyces alfalfae TaxID=1642299 RepID=A0A1P8TF60_9ACTN|nr:alpha/beta fold hydrolase [Streptomyces alfalfae]AYA16618.1 alpha/beta fold hydrolase [Streptomyces fradiae]APY86239.1 alpha/beta hydrolase [Streptomyces alfalfae]QQC91522.1 alpha/beta fold hydrolase [Streptomyces alfalfae]QUI34004.1 alpha/beta fold hydrolase [Streptomyces alfalfae]RXX48331.1 alpha/beta hydrolase [Streptomyces alfalfae]